MTDKELLSDAIIHLFNSERFYGEVILQMNKIISERIPTAGVRIKDGIDLIVNPKFFASLTLPERVAILKHECEHILRDHIGRSKEIAPELYAKPKNVERSKETEEEVQNRHIDAFLDNSKHRTMNIAADLAINGHISDLPKDAMFPSRFKLPSGETFEWYLDEIKDNKDLKDEAGDEHSTWFESEGEKEVLREKIRKLIQDAKLKTKAAGMLSSDQEMMIDKLFKNKKDWKYLLRRFTARNLRIFLETTRKKRNRRYGIKEPGRIKREKLHIGVAIDTSGSVSDHQLNQFMAEIRNISKYAMITVVEADSEIKDVYPYNPKKDYKVKGRGGTAYGPAIDYLSSEGDVDAIIYFGDMDTTDETIKKPKIPIMWAIVGSQEPPVDWGSKIRIED